MGRYVIQIARRRQRGIIEYVVNHARNFCDAVCLVVEDMQYRRESSDFMGYAPGELYKKLHGDDESTRDMLAEKYRDAAHDIDVIIYAASEGKILFGVERNDVDEFRKIPDDRGAVTQRVKTTW